MLEFIKFACKLIQHSIIIFQILLFYYYHYNLEYKINANNKEYTEIFNAEDVPDVSNEFITEFLNPIFFKIIFL